MRVLSVLLDRRLGADEVGKRLREPVGDVRVECGQRNGGPAARR